MYCISNISHEAFFFDTISHEALNNTSTIQK